MERQKFIQGQSAISFPFFIKLHILFLCFCVPVCSMCSCYRDCQVCLCVHDNSCVPHILWRHYCCKKDL